MDLFITREDRLATDRGQSDDLPGQIVSGRPPASVGVRVDCHPVGHSSRCARPDKDGLEPASSARHRRTKDEGSLAGPPSAERDGSWIHRGGGASFFRGPSQRWSAGLWPR